MSVRLLLTIVQTHIILNDEKSEGWGRNKWRKTNDQKVSSQDGDTSFSGGCARTCGVLYFRPLDLFTDPGVGERHGGGGWGVGGWGGHTARFQANACQDCQDSSVKLVFILVDTFVCTVRAWDTNEPGICLNYVLGLYGSNCLWPLALKVQLCVVLMVSNDTSGIE